MWGVKKKNSLSAWATFLTCWQLSDLFQSKVACHQHTALCWSLMTRAGIFSSFQANRSLQHLATWCIKKVGSLLLCCFSIVKKRDWSKTKTKLSAFACASCVWAGSLQVLWLPPTVQRHVHEARQQPSTVRRCEWEPDKPHTRPWCNPAFASR